MKPQMKHNVPHLQRWINIFGFGKTKSFPSCSTLMKIQHPTSQLPQVTPDCLQIPFLPPPFTLPSPPSALSGMQRLPGLQSRGTHLIPQMTKPYSLSQPSLREQCCLFLLHNYQYHQPRCEQTRTSTWWGYPSLSILFPQSIHGFCFHHSQIGYFFLSTILALS